MPLDAGTVLGDYRILGNLGTGGMGQVYKVQNTLSNRIEAMKILLPDVSAQPQQLERFIREIQVQASLVHPNIASLYTASRFEERLVMFMEFVEGDTLATMLSGGALPVQQAINVTTQLLNALIYAHERGVVHRDIKPSNIMLTGGGVVKVLDFGLAAGRGDKRLTMTGSLLGSLFYMSPEQIRGDAPTPASDIYSLGLTMYEMLTGRRGIDGPSDYAIMSAHLQFMPEPPGNVNPAIPEALGAIVMKAAAKSASQRFASALEFKAALEQYQLPPTVYPLNAPRLAASGAQPVRETSVTTGQTPALTSAERLAPTRTIQGFSTTPTGGTPVQEYQSQNFPAPTGRGNFLAIAGSIGGVAATLIGGALVYRSWKAQTEKAQTETAHAPTVIAAQQQTEPVRNLPEKAVQPTPVTTPPAPVETPPPKAATSKPTPPAPGVNTASSAPSKEDVRKEDVKTDAPPAKADAKTDARTDAKGDVKTDVKAAKTEIAAVTPPVASPTAPPAATQPVATPPPVIATPPPTVKTEQQKQAEEWARVSASRDPAQLRRFLAAHPDSPFRAQAVNMIADQDWETVRGSGDPVALRDFASRHPESSHSAEAVQTANTLERRRPVLEAISRFETAFSERELNRVRRIWPTAAPATMDRIADLFKKSRTVTLTLLPEGDLRVANGQAEVTCQEHLAFMEGGKSRTTDSTVRIRLVRVSGPWTIESITTTGPPSLYSPF